MECSNWTSRKQLNISGQPSAFAIIKRIHKVIVSFYYFKIDHSSLCFSFDIWDNISGRCLSIKTPKKYHVIVNSVRPHLKYCAQFWSPPACHGYWATVIELENVLQRIIRLIQGMVLDYFIKVKDWRSTDYNTRRKLRQVSGDWMEAY